MDILWSGMQDLHLCLKELWDIKEIYLMGYLMEARSLHPERQLFHSLLYRVGVRAWNAERKTFWKGPGLRLESLGFRNPFTFQYFSFISLSMIHSPLSLPSTYYFSLCFKTLEILKNLVPLCYGDNKFKNSD